MGAAGDAPLVVGVVVSGGTLSVLSRGTANNTVVSNGLEVVGGTANGTIVGASGSAMVSSGGEVSGPGFVVGADAYAHARSVEADTTAIIIASVLDITLTRSVFV